MNEQDVPPLGVVSSDRLGLAPERAAFEAHMDGLQYNLRRHAERPHQHANTTVQGRWISWQAAVAAEHEHVHIPISVAEARAMATVAIAWLREHAPDELKPEFRA